MSAHARWVADGSITVLGDTFIGASVGIPVRRGEEWLAVVGDVVAVEAADRGQYALIEQSDGARVMVLYRAGGSA